MKLLKIFPLQIWTVAAEIKIIFLLLIQHCMKITASWFLPGLVLLANLFSSLDVQQIILKHSDYVALRLSIRTGHTVSHIKYSLLKLWLVTESNATNYMHAMWLTSFFFFPFIFRKAKEQFVFTTVRSCALVFTISLYTLISCAVIEVRKLVAEEQ